MIFVTVEVAAMAARPERSRDAVNKIFGDALRPQSPDDRDSSSIDESEHDRWLRENMPPHHQ
ncbi:hypothetical protein ACIA48_23365 [Mycobacterium sp. NPDC051804]|uniref:hypothetical protein n=1 Tax=Mycobacterium sp. NPDC051804 TaxID=3364295 RepID=UPI0037B5FA32